MHLQENLKDFIGLLIAKQVRFAIVGGYAVVFHGYSRPVGDIDILIDPAAENVERVIAALVEYGFDEAELREQNFNTFDHIVKIEAPPSRIDLLNNIPAVETADVLNTRVAGELDGLPVHYISKELLIVNKRKCRRDKDQDDAAQLSGTAPVEEVLRAG